LLSGFVSVLALTRMAIIAGALPVKTLADGRNRSFSIGPVWHLLAIRSCPRRRNGSFEVVMEASAVTQSLGQFIRRYTSQARHTRAKSGGSQGGGDYLSIGNLRATVTPIHYYGSCIKSCAAL
jgi:hypothetical protein